MMAEEKLKCCQKNELDESKWWLEPGLPVLLERVAFRLDSLANTMREIAKESRGSGEKASRALHCLIRTFADLQLNLLARDAVRDERLERKKREKVEDKGC